MVIDKSTGHDFTCSSVGIILSECPHYKARWTVLKYADQENFEKGNPTNCIVVDGNLLLNEGINALWTLVCGGAETAFDNSNARIGVGDSITPAAATQTGLQATTNKLYKAVDGGYPTYGTSQKATWRATFGSSEANFAWNEITVANGANDSAKNLNRLVQYLGTKASPGIWTVSLEITIG